MIHQSLTYDRDRLKAICERYRIRELALFGSATREDFFASSDVDLLIEYEPCVHHGVDAFAALRAELEELFGRPVDVIEGRGRLINPYRRQTILSSLELLYAA